MLSKIVRCVRLFSIRDLVAERSCLSCQQFFTLWHSGGKTQGQSVLETWFVRIVVQRIQRSVVTIWNGTVKKVRAQQVHLMPKKIKDKLKFEGVGESKVARSTSQLGTRRRGRCLVGANGLNQVLPHEPTISFEKVFQSISFAAVWAAAVGGMEWNKLVGPCLVPLQQEVGASNQRVSVIERCVGLVVAGNAISTRMKECYDSLPRRIDEGMQEVKNASSCAGFDVGSNRSRNGDGGGVGGWAPRASEIGVDTTKYMVRNGRLRIVMGGYPYGTRSACILEDMVSICSKLSGSAQDKIEKLAYVK